jgi:hypothetical protein
VLRRSEIELGEVGHNNWKPTIPAKDTADLAIRRRTRKERMKKDECETDAEVDCHRRGAERAIARRIATFVPP